MGRGEAQDNNDCLPWHCVPEKNPYFGRKGLEGVTDLHFTCWRTYCIWEIQDLSSHNFYSSYSQKYSLHSHPPWKVKQHQDGQKYTTLVFIRLHVFLHWLYLVVKICNNNSSKIVFHNFHNFIDIMTYQKKQMHFFSSKDSLQN